jgi:hypothetical protein
MATEDNTTGEQVATDNSAALEQEARNQGWVPQDKFRGNPDDWSDAATFVKRGKEINPILRHNNARLEKELANVRAEAADAIQAAKEFREYQKEQFEKKKTDYEVQIAQLKAAKKDAITQGDGDRAVELDEALDAVKEERAALKAPVVAAPQTPSAPQVDPTLQTWIDNNPWYGKDTDESIELTELANGLANATRRKHPGLTGEAFLAKLDEALEERQIKAPKRERATPNVEGAGGNGSSGGRPNGKGRSYADLPGDAKAACDRFVKQGLMKREEYVSSYFE